MNETWMPVRGWEGLYEVSDLGNVRSLRRLVATKGGGLVWRDGVTAKFKVDSKGGGYRYTSLSRNGKAKKVNVHALVLEAFVGPRPHGCQACHIDGDRTNASLSNLRWDTIKSNHLDKRKHGTHLEGEEAPRAKLTRSEALDAISSKESSIKCAQRLGVASSTIRAIRLRHNWRSLDATV